MKIIKIIIFSIVIFAFSAYLSFYFEENYRKSIRYLFEFLTENKISFNHPIKYFHFGSGEFVSTFALFILSIIYLFQKHTIKQNITNLILGFLIFTFTTLSFCYVESLLKLAECTACGNGERELNYNDINYDKIFIISVIFTILPSVFTEIRNPR
jgi:hypothetical protein